MAHVIEEEKRIAEAVRALCGIIDLLLNHKERLIIYRVEQRLAVPNKTILRAFSYLALTVF